jgi:hypothetical protein
MQIRNNCYWAYVTSFQADPPNATLSILSGDLPREIVLVLKAPRIENDDLPVLYCGVSLSNTGIESGLAEYWFARLPRTGYYRG